MRKLLGFARETFSEFGDDDCPRMAAALSYYTVFSLPAILILVITAVGSFWGDEAVRGGIQEQIAMVLGEQGASAVGTMIAGASERTAEANLLGILILLFGATGAFAQLQTALNAVWHVERDPRVGWKGFVVKRLLSFGMILCVAFLLLVSLVLSAALTALGDRLSEVLPGAISSGVLFTFDALLSLAVITILFAAIFKFLPDAEIRWRDTWVGAGITSLLFALGKVGLGLYLGRRDFGTMFGAAGSLALVMVWIYYAAMILLLGAEITQVWVRRHGSPVRPEAGAVRVVQETKQITG